MEQAMNKKNKGTRAGREIIAALTDLRDTLAAGTPLGEKYTVRHVVVRKPGAFDARSVRTNGNQPYGKSEDRHGG
jgi:hypothetical protein